MDRKIIVLIVCLGLFLGCSHSVRQNRELPSTLDTKSIAANLGGETYQAFDPNDVESALPELGDLPLPSTLKKDRRARQYTGIIKNKTNYDVSVPAGSSSSTLIIPAKGFIEYTSWARRFDLTAYYDGKPFYCMNIYANPKNYPFGCKKYDFIIEIVKAEPKDKTRKKPIKGKKAIKGKRVEGLG